MVEHAIILVFHHNKVPRIAYGQQDTNEDKTKLRGSV